MYLCDFLLEMPAQLYDQLLLILDLDLHIFYLFAAEDILLLVVIHYLA